MCVLALCQTVIKNEINVVANLVMEEIEQTALATFHSTPHFGKGMPMTRALLFPKG